MTKDYPPEGWTIKKVIITEKGHERDPGEYWQGLELGTNKTTCFYKDYDDCLNAVQWYDAGFGQRKAEPFRRNNG